MIKDYRTFLDSIYSIEDTISEIKHHEQYSEMMINDNIVYEDEIASLDNRIFDELENKVLRLRTAHEKYVKSYSEFKNEHTDL